MLAEEGKTVCDETSLRACRGTRATRFSLEKSSEALPSAYLLVYMFYIFPLT